MDFDILMLVAASTFLLARLPFRMAAATQAISRASEVFVT